MVGAEIVHVVLFPVIKHGISILSLSLLLIIRAEFLLNVMLICLRQLEIDVDQVFDFIPEGQDEQLPLFK